MCCRFRVDYALSREQKNKKGGKMYIQDKVEEYADEVFDLLDNGAHIYFCGLKGMMPGAVALIQLSVPACMMAGTPHCIFANFHVCMHDAKHVVVPVLSRQFVMRSWTTISRGAVICGMHTVHQCNVSRQAFLAYTSSYYSLRS